jgi:nucleoside-diphosphate-sugar epimerase
MATGNHAAEANLARFAAAGGDAVALRCGWFYGPGAAHSEQLLRLARRRVVMTLGHPGSYLPSIHMADAAAAVGAAVTCVPGTYNVVDDEPPTNVDLAVPSRPGAVGQVDDAVRRRTGARLHCRPGVLVAGSARGRQHGSPP